MGKKVVTLGEIMLRLSTPGNTRFVQSDSFDVVYGGGEANVAVSCANYGHDAYFVTKLPKHEIGQSAVNALRKYGVKTDFIARGGDRVGIYYLETGASMRPSKVIYDRAHSSIAEADAADFDFDAIMEGADWFHWSGITPAISDKAAELTRLACEAAKRHGVTVSVDLNFRKKLWTKEKAQSIMKPLMQYVDVCIGNEEDAELCLGFKPDADVEGGKTDAEGYKGIFKAMAKEFGFKYVISTLRESFSATHNGWKAMIYNGEEFYESKRYDINPIIDRVGGGDSFSGGIIHGLLTKPNQGAALEFAVAASALKHTINGDFNLVSVEEVEALAGGDDVKRVTGEVNLLRSRRNVLDLLAQFLRQPSGLVNLGPGDIDAGPIGTEPVHISGQHTCPRAQVQDSLPGCTQAPGRNFFIEDRGIDIPVSRIVGGGLSPVKRLSGVYPPVCDVHLKQLPLSVRRASPRRLARRSFHPKF